MDINKENTKYLASLLSNCGATQDEINDLSFDDEVGFFESNRLADWFVSQINFGWRVWQAATAQAVPEGFVLVNKKDLVKVLNCVTDDRLVDTDSFEEFKKIESLVQDEVNAMIEAQEPTND